MIEAAVVIDRLGQPLYWHCPSNRSGGAIPDSHDLWSVIWEHRENVMGIAHTHPGAGQPEPSNEDLTTFSAIERALGRTLCWWILSENKTTVINRTTVFDIQSGDVYYQIGDMFYKYAEVSDSLIWSAELRKRSVYHEQ